MKPDNSWQIGVLEGLLNKRYGMHASNLRIDKKAKFRVVRGRIPTRARPQRLPLAHVRFNTWARRILDFCLSPFKNQIHRYRARKAHNAAVKAWLTPALEPLEGIVARIRKQYENR